MEYAIISFNNRQFMVKPGTKIEMLGILGKEGDVIKDAKTLFIKDKDITIGTPHTETQVELKIVELKKTPKVSVFKYKSKSRYRRKNGHRQDMTILEVVSGQDKTKKQTVTAAPKAAKTASKAKKAETPKKKPAKKE